jgi:hemerythrin-like domain-containing protein
MRITEALVAEHVVLRSLFDHIESKLNRLGALELRTLVDLLEAMLMAHAETETNLAYAALDQVLADKGQLERLHQDHHEIDARLKATRQMDSLPEARRLLRSVLAGAREHFEAEELGVFPLIERTLGGETLTRLGEAWTRQHGDLQPTA